MSSGPLSSFFSRPGARLLAGLAVFSVPAVRCAADMQALSSEQAPAPTETPESNGPTLSEAISEQFEQLKPLVDAKQWNAALSMLDRIAALVADPNSYQGGYDMAVILDTKAKTLVEADRLGEAVAPWEEVLSLTAKHPSYFYKRQISDILHYLAQIYGQEASAIKPSPGPDLAEREATQRDDFNKSLSYMQRWMDGNPNVSQDDQLFYADMLFNLASISTGDAATKRLDQAEQEAVKGLHLAVHPRDEFYYLVAAAAQQKGDLPRAAHYLELLAQLHPESKVYSPQLMGIYTDLAASPKEKANSREYYLRAVNAILRGQAHGLMVDQKTNLVLVTIYFDMGQFGLATDLLGSGLRNGGIDPSEGNWQLLAYSYQQINENDKAIEAYQDAEKLFPDDGQFDSSIAQIYYQTEDMANAYKYFAIATQKDHLTSPYGVYIEMAYAAFEINNLDGALAACNAAAKYPEAAKDSQVEQLRSVIQDKIAAQQKAKNPTAPAPAPASL